MKESEIHIWQLPEKDEKVDKEKDYMITHDGFSLKKVKLKILYEYFSQQEKVDSMTNSITNKIEVEDKNLDDKHSELKNISENNNEIIKDLKDKFNQVTESIIDITSRISTTENEIAEIQNSNNSIEYKSEVLDSSFETCDEDIKKLSKEYSEIYSDNILTFNEVNELDSDIYKIKNKSLETNNKLVNLKTEIETKLENKKENFIKKLHLNYDLILEILDHYHHGHDE